jgi:glycosyltransferase involved in cell wall biosynthesis
VCRAAVGATPAYDARVEVPNDGGPGRCLSIVLPAFNEQANIALAIESASAVGQELCSDHEIIVVDDGSLDATAAIVTDLAGEDRRIRLICHPRNMGYGEALRSGFSAARMPLVFFTDADNQFDMRQLAEFLPLIESVDVVAGYRVQRCDSRFRRLNAVAWNYLVRALYYVPVRDIDCAYKLFRREVFDGLQLDSVGAMVNTELMVKLGRSGYRVVEIGVRHYPRRAGTARGASLRVIARALYELVRMHQRLKTADLAQLRPPTSRPA